MDSKTLTNNNMLDYLIKLAPAIQEAIPFEAMIGVTDTKNFLLYLPTKDLNLGGITGMTIPEGDAIYEAIKKKSTQMISVPREAFGIPFKAKGVPIKDGNGNVIGGLGIGISLDNQEKLSDVAQQFASASEEISASTEELSSTAQKLANFMKDLKISQHEMIEQVGKTEKMLESISTIGRNSRILGLNAGIEAARSGEHGRGFSVVAQEITKLADISATSVDEIRSLLRSLKEKVEYITETVNKTTKISNEQFASSDNISTAINHLIVSVEEIDKLSKII
ncbi:methyl-accepting chemotaxis protein [Sporosarcina limicola]|uniref:Uncharacterized protein YukE n=1 Tax=Sporosarcina limicola TaxID=34101 RepID=A0A927RE67_9BACL|nr:methyl-accepting chemotaxis protein [Sporosarcina limicola]MBE1554312.1 uncharacterized protein YukE [Sporosarcina limicola]